MLYAAISSEALSPFDWIKALYLYGPAAASVLCIVLLEPRARSQFKNANIPNLVAIPVYALTWIAILGFLVAATFVFLRLNRAEATIRGQFELRTKEQTISSRKASIFLRKEYDPGSPGYEFRIVTPAKISDGETIPFFLDPGTGKDATKYELPVRDAYYNQAIDITYHPSDLFDATPGKFEVRSGSLDQSLNPLSAAVASPAAASYAPNFWQLLAVHAQVAPRDDVALLHDLDSEDPIIRGDARNALRSKREAALPAIQDILADGSASYRKKLGSIVALAGMQGVSLGSLSAEAFSGINNSANSGDPTLMAWITKLLDGHPELRSKISIDPFVGVWRLDQAKSRLEPSLQESSYGKLSDENRRITRTGDRITVTIRRVFAPKGTQKETVYQFACDGKPWKTAGQTLTCVQKGPSVAEGDQSPPKQFYRREVSPDGRTMTISVFGDQSKEKLASLEVYDRLTN